MQHGEQNSHLSMAPQTIREILDRYPAQGGNGGGPRGGGDHGRRPVFPAANGGASLPNLFCLSHNEVPAGVKVVSLGIIQ